MSPPHSISSERRPSASLKIPLSMRASPVASRIAAHSRINSAAQYGKAKLLFVNPLIRRVRGLFPMRDDVHIHGRGFAQEAVHRGQIKQPVQAFYRGPPEN